MNIKQQIALETMQYRKVEAPESFLTSMPMAKVDLTLFGDVPNEPSMLQNDVRPQSDLETMEYRKVPASEGFLTRGLVGYADPDAIIKASDKKYTHALVIEAQCLFAGYDLESFDRHPDGTHGSKQVDTFIQRLHDQNCAVVLMYNHPQAEYMYALNKDAAASSRARAENVFKRAAFDALYPNPYSNYTMHKKYKPGGEPSYYNKYGSFDWVDTPFERIGSQGYKGHRASFGAMARELGIAPDNMKVIVSSEEACKPFAEERRQTYALNGNGISVVEPPASRHFYSGELFDVDHIQSRLIGEVEKTMQLPKTLAL